jgi:NADP-dependent 3-hydroxy acid dehydrogenase YdfG
MRIVVITGSTRGIGFGIAESFLKAGCKVMISGRTDSSIKDALGLLRERYEKEEVDGQVCDVRNYSDLEGLWQAAIDRYGKVDIWINNAGLNHKLAKIWELAPEEISAIVDTNLLGVIYGSRVAVQGMVAQGYGSIYNMEGFGSDGRKMEGMSIYGSTKYGLRYFNETLEIATRNLPVIVGSISPGMVMTDMLLKEDIERTPEESERARRIFNILADRVETVTPWIVEKILTNQKTRVRIAWLTPWKITGRFLTAPFRKRDLYEEN